MAIRASPLMGLGALLQGYDQQRSEDQRRRAYEEQMRQAALLRASQGAIGATLTAPGGIGGGVGSSPYAGLANLAGGGAQPPLSPAPLSSPDIGGGPRYGQGDGSPDSMGSGPKSYSTSPGNPATAADAGVMDIPGASMPSPSGTMTGQDVPGAGVPPQGGGAPAWMQAGAGAMGLVGPPGAGPQLAPPQPQAYQQPPGAMRNLMPMRPGVPSTLDTQPVPGGARPMPPPGPYLGTDGQLHPPPPGMGSAQPQPPPPSHFALSPRPMTTPAAAPTPQAQPSPAQGGGQQQPFNPADLLNPERSLDFASNIAQRVKAANPNASNEVIAMATVDLMKSIAGQDRVGLALALANMRDITTRRGQDQRYDQGEQRLGQGQEKIDQGKRRLDQGDRRLGQGDQRIELQKQRLTQQKQRYATLDAQKEQARKDAIARGDRSTYIRVLTAQLAEIRSQLGNMMRTADMSPEEKQAAQAKEKELTDELGRLQGQTRPQ